MQYEITKSDERESPIVLAQMKLTKNDFFLRTTAKFLDFLSLFDMIVLLSVNNN